MYLERFHRPSSLGMHYRCTGVLARSHQQPREGRFAEPLLLKEVVHRFRRITVQVLGEGHEERVAGPAVVVVPEATHDKNRRGGKANRGQESRQGTRSRISESNIKRPSNPAKKQLGSTKIIGRSERAIETVRRDA